MRINPDFRYDPDERGGGRTTKMLLMAIDLAIDPQDIVIVTAGITHAEQLLRYTLDILNENDFGFKSFRAERRPMPVIHLENGSSFHFVPPNSQVGKWVAQANRVSILFDHKTRETASPIDLERWDIAIRHIIAKAQRND